ncbi:porin family protein [Persicobacter psychrovividus]|uniref:Outer membrane protein beta-barrel domain-containing protein n=1 Tax=Persicobacter psychrovividus TaxID=387638 RepID=A0ABM7V9X8_9BACT|nr:hypothetical protein PEPS_00170 [Persicobacter psychrovividus]
MKKNWILLLATLFLSVQAMAQDNTDANQAVTNNINVTQKTPRPNLPGSFLVQFGFNNTAGGDNAFRLNWWQSKFFNTYYMYPMPLTEKISFNAGLGISINNWAFQDQVGITTDRSNTGEQVTVISDNATDFPFANMSQIKKSKLTVTYLDLPLEFRYTSKGADGNRGFRFAAGGKVGYRLGGGNSKQTLKIDGDKKIYKAKEDFFLNDWRYGLTSSIGYSWFNVSFYYGLSDIFQSNKLRSNGDLTPSGAIDTGNPYEIGITLDLF